jgi:hypothetical protein
MKCVKCGCTDEKACPRGCTWVQTNPPICSRCAKTSTDLMNRFHNFVVNAFKTEKDESYKNALKWADQIMEDFVNSNEYGDV